MDASNNFNLEHSLNEWIKYNCSEDVMTHNDRQDIKEHMFLTVDELVKDKNLTEEEAFAVAKVRFGGKDDWLGDMQLANDRNFQLEKTIILLSGIFIFLFANYFVQCANKCMFIIFYKLNVDNDTNIEIIKTFNKSIFAITIILFIAAFYKDLKIISWIKRLHIRPFIILLFIIALFTLFIFDWYLITKVNSTVTDTIYKNLIFRVEKKFKNYYLLMAGIGYIILFFRYYKIFKKQI